MKWILPTFGGLVFHYESWDVFRALLELRALSARVARRRLVAYWPDAQQLNRAACSSVDNLAEGAREQNAGKKLERYRTTLSSISECNRL